MKSGGKEQQRKALVERCGVKAKQGHRIAKKSDGYEWSGMAVEKL